MASRVEFDGGRLTDFSKTEIENILEHSGAKAVIVSEKLKRKVAGIKCSDLKTIIKIYCNRGFFNFSKHNWV